MTAIINGDSPSVTFSDGTTQATSAIVSGKVPYTNLPAGSVLQVVSATYSTNTGATTSTRIDTGLTATITPKFATSKILVLVNIGGNGKNSGTGGGPYVAYWLMRNSTDIIKFEGEAGYTANTNTLSFGTCSTTYLDSPATTSATTYKVQFSNAGNTGTVSFNNSSSVSTITLMEIAQ